VYDWETANNNEPFWSAMRDLDLGALVAEAGFATDKVIQKFVPNGAWQAKVSNNNSQNGKLRSLGSWFIVAAIK
jgi:hypothetical protein